MATLNEFSQLLENHRLEKWPEEGSTLRRRKQIHKVQPLLRLKKEKMEDHVYDPLIVSIGPHHHGKPELQAAEHIKYRYLDRFVSGKNEIKIILYNKILEQIDSIRGCYAESLEEYNDTCLALIMLLDASFILTFLEGMEKEGNIFMDPREGEGGFTISLDMAEDQGAIFLDWHSCVGKGTLGLVTRDLMVLDNQIPFHVIKLMVIIINELEDNDNDKAKAKEELVLKFLNWVQSSKFKVVNKIPLENENPPLHFPEALHRMLVDEEKLVIDLPLEQKQATTGDDDVDIKSYEISWSAMDLKAKGIKFKCSDSYSMRHLKFKLGSFYSTLHLPPLIVSQNALNNILNMIAYEMSPDSDTKYEVLSYTNFLKLLITSPEDVKELQEQNILIDGYCNQQQVVEVFKGIETFGLDNFDIFNETKKEIGKHCRRSVKTILAQQIYNLFSSPWAMFGFMAFISFTLLQVFL